MVLRGSGSPLGVAEIADRIGVHPNTARFHLEALHRAGQVEQAEVHPAGPGRPPLAYRARPGMDPAGPRSYRLLAAVLAGEFATGTGAESRAIEAGRAWGAELIGEPTRSGGLTPEQAIARLGGLLEDLGFAPEQRPSIPGWQLGLRHCPFLELVEAGAGIVCSLHLGLMQGAVDALDTSVTVERLDPFVEPDLCLAQLGDTAAAARPDPSTTPGTAERARS